MNIPDLEYSSVQAPLIQHRAVRDLAWALLQKPLFSAIPDLPESWLHPSWLDHTLPAWLHQLDQQPKALLEHLKDQRATRLGIYFEQLLSFYFSHFPRFELIAKNLQVNDSQRTLGEYDFIVLDHRDEQYYHYEVAVKYYLGYPQQQATAHNIDKNIPLHNWHLWIGPNKKDSLAIKMNHLSQHQLALAHTDAGKAGLDNIGLSGVNLNSKLLLTGCLYQPLTQTLAPPRYNNPNLETYQWLNDTQINHENAFVDDKAYIILPRQLWLADITTQDIATYSLKLENASSIKATIEAYFRQDSQPLHITELQKTCSKNNRSDIQQKQQWQQKRRLFVVLDKT